MSDIQKSYRALTRGISDDCAYKQRLHESTSPLLYQINPIANEACVNATWHILASSVPWEAEVSRLVPIVSTLTVTSEDRLVFCPSARVTSMTQQATSIAERAETAIKVCLVVASIAVVAT
jgi:hypothetical protein